jgi:mono/diheme cytochrome c family protein
MKKHSRTVAGWLTRIALAVLALAALVLAMLLLESRPVHALPEYSTLTGETCAACHVSPGGGGPRTLRGLLWGALGQPSELPRLPNALIAPGVADGADLYDIACAACHGQQGQGLYAMRLTGTGIGPASVRSFIRRGIVSIGMPAFDGQFTDDQMEALVAYVAGLASGQIPPPPLTEPLPPAHFRCAPAAEALPPGCPDAPTLVRDGN